MRRFFLWNPSYFKELVPKMVKLLDEDFETFDNFDEENGLAVLNENDIFERLCEALLEEEELEGIISSDDFEPFVEKFRQVFDKYEPKYFEDKEQEVNDLAREAHMLTKDPLGHYGMSQKDFI